MYRDLLFCCVSYELICHCVCVSEVHRQPVLALITKWTSWIAS